MSHSALKTFVDACMHFHFPEIKNSYIRIAPNKTYARCGKWNYSMTILPNKYSMTNQPL